MGEQRGSQDADTDAEEEGGKEGEGQWEADKWQGGIEGIGCPDAV